MNVVNKEFVLPLFHPFIRFVIKGRERQNMSDATLEDWAEIRGAIGLCAKE